MLVPTSVRAGLHDPRDGDTVNAADPLEEPDPDDVPTLLPEGVAVGEFSYLCEHGVTTGVLIRFITDGVPIDVGIDWPVAAEIRDVLDRLIREHP